MAKLDSATIIRGNHRIVRNVNRAAILNLIRKEQPISRAALSKLSELNKSTVSSIVNDLLEEGLVHETTDGKSTGGRKPILLRLSRSQQIIGAIDFDQEHSFVAIGDIEANILKKKAIKTQKRKPERVIRDCLVELFELQRSLGCPNLRSIGISVPGIVDARTGTVVVAPDLNWRNIETKGLVDEIVHVNANMSVIIENEANSSALAEQWFGNALRNKSNIVFVSEGIGTGVILGGELIQGSVYLAGQFGHMTIQADGRQCVCGNRGCWELYASNTATVERFYASRQQTFKGNPAQEVERIISLAQEGEADATAAVRETARYLGIGISNIMKGIDPETVILGGTITRAWELIYPEIMEEIESRVFFGLKKSVEIVPTCLKERSSLMGAFTLAIREIFRGYKITI